MSWFQDVSGETLSVNLTQRVDGRVSVFVADFTVAVDMAIVETCFAHGALHCAYSLRGILPLGPDGKLAPQPGHSAPPGLSPAHVNWFTIGARSFQNSAGSDSRPCHAGRPDHLMGVPQTIPRPVH